jgi:hypothetical protein
VAEELVDCFPKSSEALTSHAMVYCGVPWIEPSQNTDRTQGFRVRSQTNAADLLVKRIVLFDGQASAEFSKQLKASRSSLVSGAVCPRGAAMETEKQERAMSGE